MLIDVNEKEYACLLRIRAANDEMKNVYYGVLNVPYDDWFIERSKEMNADRIKREWQERMNSWKQIDTEYGRPMRIKAYYRGIEAMNKEIERCAQETDRKQQQCAREIRQLIRAQQQILPGIAASDPAQLAQIPPEIQRGLD